MAKYTAVLLQLLFLLKLNGMWLSEHHLHAWCQLTDPSDTSCYSSGDNAYLLIECIEGELCSVVCAADGGHVAPHHAGVGLAIILTVPLPILLDYLQQELLCCWKQLKC